MRAGITIIFIFAMSAFMLSCNMAEDDRFTITMGFAPSEDAQAIDEQAKELAALIEERTGYRVKTKVLANYAFMVAALETDDIDFAWLPPKTYTQAEDAGVARVLLKVVRNNHPWYYGAIVVRSDSDIQTPEDLRGKEIAWGDTTSFSGHVFPKYKLMESGLYSDDFFKVERNLGNHLAVVLSVLNGDVDAGACFANNTDGDDGAWTQLIKDPEKQKQFRVVLYTDPIPGDTFSVRTEFAEEHPEIVKEIKKLMVELPADPEGSKIMDELYHVQALTDAEPEDYQVVRKASKAIIE